MGGVQNKMMDLNNIKELSILVFELGFWECVCIMGE
jgi:hypothetical protein